ncbi:collectin-12-like [Homarus americanus]|uniref:Mannose-binding protein-like n=1 Tax=Homarus americanus TaxID=6706 RepID=A0A8J5JYB6_HOMAM|nr:collectin-12-like [Homarus americanus]KAG7161634.1 mannose-binding protein-like [Homarus americanus]
MKTVILLLASVTIVAPQARYPGGGIGNFPGAGGGAIQFPGSSTGGTRPIRPARPGAGGSVRPGGGGGILPGGTGIFGGNDQGSGGTGGQDLSSPPPLSTAACPPFLTPQVHYNLGGRQYHYSWCVDGGQRYNWQEANNYCRRLGNGWQAISIETAQEDQFVVNILDSHDLPYIWTSGNRLQGRGWVWGNGQLVYYTNWAKTGFVPNRPQPDNHFNNEQCLSVLNRFYPNDGITWHDIECHHVKPTICERAAQSYSG